MYLTKKIDYKIPKSGYVDVREFETPKNLAEYLRYLDRNQTAYNSYFKWKKHVSFENIPPNFSILCNMCIQLHLEEYFGIEKNVVDNIGDMWNPKRNCKKIDFSKNNKSVIYLNY